MPIKHVNTDRDKRTDALHEAEMKHQQECMQSNLLVKSEEVRRSRVRSTILRDDVATLRAQIAQHAERHEKLSQQSSDARNKLVTATRKCSEQDKKLKTQAREIAALKTELQSLNGVSNQSTKILSEKLALARELANMQPELEHLRSQVAHHNDVLAEKLALERQANTLEVELANEKRAAQRAIQRQESKGNEVEEDLRHQIQELEKKLAAEKRAAERAKQEAEKGSGLEDTLRQRVEELEAQLATDRSESAKARRETERQLTEAQGQNEFLTERLGEIKTKLKETRQELKGCRAELEEAKKSAASRAVENAVAAKTKAKAQVSRKRRVNEMDEEDILQTPTQEDPRAKRPLKKRIEALVGEKSTFSITPFLTKTISFAEGAVEFTAGGGSPSGAPTEMEVDEDVTNDTTSEEAPAPAEPQEAVSPTPAKKDASAKQSKKAAEVAKQPKPRGRPKTKVALRESPSAKLNMSLTSSRKTSSRTENTLEKVMEEAEEEQENRTVAAPKGILATTAKGKVESKAAAKQASADAAEGSLRESGASSLAAEAEPKKKKRKLLGGANKTLFEDDDGGLGEVLALKRQPSKVQLGAAKGPLGKVQMGGLGRGAFAGKTFSPLKRDRRGVNASFLA